MDIILYTTAVILIEIALASAQRYCYVCSGHRCLQNPMDPDLFPGRTKCHEVDNYCVTHVRYLATNETIKAYMEEDGKLAPKNYSPQSITRSCAKTYLGNLCRRDYNHEPHITCISTCTEDFCNCDSRSPPVQMFVKGKVQYESPKKSTWSANDLLPCQAMAGVPGYEAESEVAVRRRPDARGGQGRRRYHRRNAAIALSPAIYSLTLAPILVSMIYTTSATIHRS